MSEEAKTEKNISSSSFLQSFPFIKAAANTPEQPVRDTAMQENPIAESPAQDNPVANAPASDRPQGSPMPDDPQNDPMQNSGAQSVPTQNNGAQNAPAQNSGAQSAPTQNSGAQNAPAQNNGTQSTPTQNTPTQDNAQENVPENLYSGNLKISVVSAIGLIPIPNAAVTISYTGDPETPLMELTTDRSGQTPTIALPAPPLSLSLTPDAEQQPYSEYNIFVTAEGYEPVFVSGSEIFANELSLQPIRMNPVATTQEAEKIVIIPAHTLFGEYPPKIEEDEIKPMSETGEIVLSRVVVPEYVIVHDGAPSDATASDYWVRYKDYIKNVASCEIYSTWPESSIYANILAIQSFTLNRVYTEW